MENRTEISELGEFGLIERLIAPFQTRRGETVKGAGDDSAVLGTGEEKLLVSTDMLVEGVHFDLMYTPLKHLGYKAVMVNISDICAMNGEATHITVSIAISNRFSVEAVEELYAGIRRACENYRVDLIGGDTTSSLGGLIISITVMGRAKESAIAYRSGAENKDLLVVSGDLGGAYMGLQILEREKSVFKEAPGVQPELTGFDYVLERQLKPEARVDVVKLLSDLNVKPSSMIDISDGLASEAIHLCEASKKGVMIFEDKLPVHENTKKASIDFGIDSTTCALNGGEDYELLFTVSQADYEKLKEEPGLAVIGYMTDPDEGYNFIDRGGSQHPLKAQGWDSVLGKSRD